MIGTRTGANTSTSSARTASALSISVVTVETTRHARASSSFANSPATTGIIADDSAPAATSWNRKSGIRNAAKNESSCDGSGHRGRDDDVAQVAEDPRDRERDGDDDPGPGDRPGRGAGPPVVLAGRRSRDRRGVVHVGDVVHHELRARGWASRYASRSRPGETWV